VTVKRALAIALLLATLPLLSFADDSSTNTQNLSNNLFQGCWTCGAFNTIGAIGLSFADQAFTTLSSSMFDLISFCMVMWLLYFAAKLFLPFGPPGSSHWNVGAVKMLKLMIVMAFLQSGSAFWDYVFTPILSSGLGIAASLATTADKSYQATYGKDETIPQSSGTSVDYCSNSPPAGGQTAGPNTGAALTALEQMDCPLQQIQAQYAKGILIGVSVMGQAACTKSFLSFFLPTENAIADLLAGLILVLMFGFGYLVFPFLLLDVLMRVVLVAITSPLAIASILFKSTEKIASRSAWSLVQCGLTLMFGAAIAGIGKSLMAYILGQMGTLANGTALNNWSNLTTALEQSCSSNFQVDFTHGSFYMLCGTAMLMIFMMRRASSLAAELTGVAGSVGATAAAGAMAGAAANLVGKAGQLAVGYMMTKAAMSKANQVTGNNGGGRDRSKEVAGNQ